MKAALRFTVQHVRTLVLVLCAIAAARVFIFSAAFPFFNNVDEQAHADLVMKYARGQVPRDLGHYSPESAYSFSLCGTPDYFTAPEQLTTGTFPPPTWTLPAIQREDVINRTSAWWQANENHESGEPPFYYAIAGAWLNLGRAFGITGCWLLYWVRFLNVFVAAILVWMSFIATSLVFPDNQFMRLSVPLLLAVWPQTSFYSIQNDLLSPLCFGFAFIGLVKFLQSGVPSLPVAISTGPAIAATCLVKTTNIALLLAVGIALILKIHNLAERRTLRPVLVSLAVLAVSAVVPIAVWFAWNYHTFGDLTATGSKIDFLGWTRKPIREWCPHPIFTLNGVKQFWPQLMASFWRGEFIWHGKRLASQPTDAFYWISSSLAILLAVISLFMFRTKLTTFQRESLWLAFSSFAAVVLFVAVLSVAFDFGLCVYPSREHPFFTSGRLLSAAAIPFFLLYCQALNWALSWSPRIWPRVVVVAGIVLFILASQFVINRPAFASRYNFFHLSQAL